MQMFLSVARRNHRAWGECSLQNCIHFPVNMNILVWNSHLNLTVAGSYTKAVWSSSCCIQSPFSRLSDDSYPCPNTSCVHTNTALPTNRVRIIHSGFFCPTLELNDHQQPKDGPRSKILNMRSRWVTMAPFGWARQRGGHWVPTKGLWALLNPLLLCPVCRSLRSSPPQ